MDTYSKKHIMAKMTEQQYAEMTSTIESVLSESVTKEYAQAVLNKATEVNHTPATMLAEIVADILETSAWDEMQEYSISDVRLAIGRVLLWHLGESC